MLPVRLAEIISALQSAEFNSVGRTDWKSMFRKIVSGGQTGVDRAALDVALKHGIECGGWCPAGRVDEFGRIPNRYPVKELEHGSFAERTLQNVKDSDGTIVIFLAKLRGGTEFTVECCKQLQRPHKLIDAAKMSASEAAGAIVDFVRDHKIEILNVAGPRQSEWPEGYEYACRAIDQALRVL
jgi:Circularly permutated YpsA SLOG family